MKIIILSYIKVSLRIKQKASSSQYIQQSKV
nr:MAG TPA: hypothetical protein [Caudoviricetes sp.]